MLSHHKETFERRTRGRGPELRRMNKFASTRVYVNEFLAGCL